MKLLFVLTLFLFSVTCTKQGGENPVTNPPADTAGTVLPVLPGRLVFHSYSCYSCNDSRLYLYNFKTKQLTHLSQNWAIVNPMNAHFSPDGNKIVFMGQVAGTANWDIFLYTLGDQDAPVNLTAGSSKREEDPKFSADGSRIVFKQNDILKEMDTLGQVLKSYELPHNSASMPYYTRNGSGILYSGNEPTGERADIYMVATTDGSVKALSALANVEEYYPIARDDTSFLFTRWRVYNNYNDQIYLGFYDGRPSVRLPFNESDQNFSDAYPVDGRWVVLSSTKPNGSGAYDLYLADMISGKTHSLTKYRQGINSPDNELGACYHE